MRQPDHRSPFQLDTARHPLPVIRWATPPIEQLLGLTELDRLYQTQVFGAASLPQFMDAALAALELRLELDPADLARIPKTGPVLVVANHPFGGADALALSRTILAARPDSRLMANFILSRVHELADFLIPVDPFGTERSARANLRGLRTAISHLRGGGLLGVFPAGEVAHVRLRDRGIADPPWSASVGRLARMTGATVVPVFFAGENGPLFQLAGLVHPRLRTAMLPAELLNKRGRTICAQIGTPIPAAQLARFADDAALTAYLRERTYALGSRCAPARPAAPHIRLAPRPAAIAAPELAAACAAEVAALPPGALLAEHQELAVYLAEAAQLPHTLREIGRLREIAFRAVGEGSGLTRDLDRFDPHYQHLFIWHRTSREVVGAYRLGLTDRIVGVHGVRGLYISTLFHFPAELLVRLGPAVELGRSFIRPEYQRSFAPLMLLWRGIGQFAMRNPRYSVLYGPVSISASYAPASRRLIAEFLRERHFDTELARMVRPRTPPRAPQPVGWRPDRLGHLTADMDELADVVQDMERDGKGVPVLLRQYLRLGGRVLGFNLDRTFGDVLDALLVMDLRQADDRTLGRYVGREQLAAFRAFHGRG